MAPEAIRTEILASLELRSLIEQGDEKAIADHLTTNQPGKNVPLRISELGLIALYANPMDAETVLQTIEAVANGPNGNDGNPIIKRILKFMQPGVPENSLPDFSLPAVRNALKAPIELGGLGLSDTLAQPLLDASEVPDVVTEQEVADACAAWRTDGIHYVIPS